MIGKMTQKKTRGSVMGRTDHAANDLADDKLTLSKARTSVPFAFGFGDMTDDDDDDNDVHGSFDAEEGGWYVPLSILMLTYTNTIHVFRIL